jgi:8-oxo-dGTP pyrophosphatase MutT (NUDIX family)
VTWTDLAALEALLRARLTAPLPGADAHRRMAPRPARANWQPGVVPDTARPAAALILLYPRDGRIVVPLTVRHSAMPHHPGQISLPGGRVDGDETPDATALREAHEEIGIDTSTVRLIGALTPFFVFISNFVIQPYVAVTDVRPDFRIARCEVEALVEAPLDDLLDPAHVQWGTRTREGYLIDFPFFDIAGLQIWGATAMILSELAAVLER